jgi:hypothetical protein
MLPEQFSKVSKLFGVTLAAYLNYLEFLRSFRIWIEVYSESFL